MFYYWFTGMICLVALVSTLYLGFSHKNQVASESYTKHTVKNLNSLLIYLVHRSFQSISTVLDIN
jgi:hypothetical protein